jgi:DNA primase
LLEKIPEGVYRELLSEEVAKLVRIDSARLVAAMAAKDSRRPGIPASAPQRVRPLAPVIPGGRGSVVRQAVRILVHYPMLAPEAAGSEGLEQVNRPGIPLLIELLNDLQENPCTNTASLLERWRGRPDFEHLSRLAGAEYPAGREGAAGELAGALKTLLAESSNGRLEELLRKQSSLTESERIELQGFLTNDRSGS